MGLIEMERMKRYSEKPTVLGYLGNTVNGGGNLQKELADRIWSHTLWVTLRELGGTDLL